MSTKPAILDSFSIVEAEQEINTHEQAIHESGEPYRYLVLLLLLCHAPVVLIQMGIIPFEYRFFIFFPAMAGFITFCFHRKYRLGELGFRTDNLKSALVWNLIFCVVGGIGLVLMYKAGFLRTKIAHYPLYVYLFYIFFLGPVQELIFRGVFFLEVKQIPGLGNRFFLAISTLSFCFLHIIYNHPPLLFIALVSGLAWGIIFIKKPNFWGLSLSHSFLGALAMALKLI